MIKTTEYINKNKDVFLDELLGLLKIPSVSADSKFKDDVRKTALFIKEKFENAGVDKAEIFETKGHPVVYAEKFLSSEFTNYFGFTDIMMCNQQILMIFGILTLLIQLLKKQLFILREQFLQEERVMIRGQMYMHIKAFESMMSANELPCNVKFMIEGRRRGWL